MLDLSGIPVILASQSPRRKELLSLLIPAFRIEPAGTDETLPEGIPPDQGPVLLALRKARLVATEHPEALVIGADTVVAAPNGEILGKPKDQADGARMLGLLAGKRHWVYTGVAFCRAGKEHTFCCGTEVEMAPMSREEIAWYLSTGEAMDKAGAYGIQGAASRFIRRIAGDYFNVMGLPVNGLYENLTNFMRAG